MKTKLFLFATGVLLLTLSDVAYSQCTYHSTDSAGQAVSADIPCNFPVYINTGDPAADGQRFQSAANDWSVNYPVYPELSAGMMPLMGSNYISIPQSAFDLFPAEKKNVITSFPNTFRVSQ
jgi:hypothetical protein